MPPFPPAPAFESTTLTDPPFCPRAGGVQQVNPFPPFPPVAVAGPALPPLLPGPPLPPFPPNATAEPPSRPDPPFPPNATATPPFFAEANRDKAEPPLPAKAAAAPPGLVAVPFMPIAVLLSPDVTKRYPLLQFAPLLKTRGGGGVGGGAQAIKNLTPFYYDIPFLPFFPPSPIVFPGLPPLPPENNFFRLVKLELILF